MLTFSEVRHEILNRVKDPIMRDMYIRVLTNLENASIFSPDAVQNRLRQIMEAIGAYEEMKKANAPGTIALGTLSGTFAGIGNVLKSVGDIAIGLLKKPWILLLLAGAIGIGYLTIKGKLK